MTTHTQLALTAVPVLLLTIGWMLRQWHLTVKERLDEMRARIRALERNAIRVEALERTVDRLDRKVHSMETSYISYHAAEGADAKPQ